MIRNAVWLVVASRKCQMLWVAASPFATRQKRWRSEMQGRPHTVETKPHKRTEVAPPSSKECMTLRSKAATQRSVYFSCLRPLRRSIHLDRSSWPAFNALSCADVVPSMLDLAFVWPVLARWPAWFTSPSLWPAPSSLQHSVCAPSGLFWRPSRLLQLLPTGQISWQREHFGLTGPHLLVFPTSPLSC